MVELKVLCTVRLLRERRRGGVERESEGMKRRNLAEITSLSSNYKVSMYVYMTA